jgi:hypothetical protein
MKSSSRPHTLNSALTSSLVAAALLLLTFQFAKSLISTEVRPYLQGMVALFLLVNVILSRALQPNEGDSKGKFIRVVMVASMVKMFLTLGVIAVYLVLKGPDPIVFAIGGYLVYAVFAAILVALALKKNG